MEFKMNTEELKALSYADFVDQIEGHLGSLDELRPFLEKDILPRTLEYAEELNDSLEAQLEAWADPNQPDYNADWVKRTRGFRSLVQSRIKLLKRSLGTPQQGELGQSHTQELKAWKRFAHQLCEVLDDYDEANLELDVINVPYCNMTARAWLARRLEKDPLRTGVNA
jgi:hypothetical protein